MKAVRILRPVWGAVLLGLLFSFALSAEPAARYIKGSVTSPSGRPLTSVWVTVSQNGEEKGRSLTGDDGKYYISNLYDGTYDIAVLQGNRQVYTGQVNLPENTVHDILVKRQR
ncbi:MAG TPA: carboxypeptidase-like regulatory domain-containing protein [Pyrinomonadaceae bacterium]|nr:carboxypeptidase-like regulatory domain-containing protein [Pyrinomonadaceae bacterium]